MAELISGFSRYERTCRRALTTVARFSDARATRTGAVARQAADVEVGEVQTFRQLLVGAPQADVSFWRVWYFGSIPWQRETVTPASVPRTPGLKTVFDGVAR